MESKYRAAVARDRVECSSARHDKELINIMPNIRRKLKLFLGPFIFSNLAQ
jgi:hypothetical protein